MRMVVMKMGILELGAGWLPNWFVQETDLWVDPYCAQ